MTNAPQQNVGFSMERVYLKDASYEAPNVPHMFLEQKAPEINIHLEVSHQKLEGDGGYYEVVLAITANAKTDDKTVFLVEVQQAGLFVLQGIADDEMLKVLEIACSTILLPFAREVINDFVGKGGFPQLLINPVNFEALYQQKHAKVDKTVKH
ncbi:MAG: protein-export chaperone SecB [Gammaproteobacteria bacterium]|nr:MAG: protein-export chaperone SecB [Gammaproteobacteria bacterium]